MVACDKVKVHTLKKPEGLPTILDNYEGPELEKYEKIKVEKKVKDKPETKLAAKRVIPVVQSPAQDSTKVSFVFLLHPLFAQSIIIK